MELYDYCLNVRFVCDEYRIKCLECLAPLLIRYVKFIWICFTDAIMAMKRELLYSSLQVPNQRIRATVWWFLNIFGGGEKL